MRQLDIRELIAQARGSEESWRFRDEASAEERGERVIAMAEEDREMVRRRPVSSSARSCSATRRSTRGDRRDGEKGRESTIRANTAGRAQAARSFRRRREAPRLNLTPSPRIRTCVRMEIACVMVPEAVLRAVGEERRSCPARTSGRTSCGGSRGSARRSSRSGRGRRSSRSTACAGSTAAGARGWSRRRGAAAAMPVADRGRPDPLRRLRRRRRRRGGRPRRRPARVPRPAAGRRPDPAPRPRRARGGGPGRDPGAARHRHPGRARRPRPGQVADRFGPPGLRRPAARPRRGAAAAHPPSPRGARPPRSSCRKGPPAASSSAPSSCSSTASSPPRSARAARARRCASAPCSATAAAGASSRGWAGRPPRRGSCARVLAPRLEALPAPAIALRLRAIALGPPVGDQLELSVRRPGAAPPSPRRGGARGPRRAGGRGAAQGPRRSTPPPACPERRAVLTPFRP